jgi:hypothetical protein
MSRNLPLGLLALTTLLALSPGVSASTATGSYTIATTPGLSVVCSPNCLGVPGANIGGFQFPANGAQPVSVSIADASGGAVSFTVCQDTNGNGLCGEAGEPNVVRCGKSALLGSAFNPALEISVFVRITNNDCVGNVATSGTITITYNP